MIKLSLAGFNSKRGVAFESLFVGLCQDTSWFGTGVVTVWRAVFCLKLVNQGRSVVACCGNDEALDWCAVVEKSKGEDKGESESSEVWEIRCLLHLSAFSF